MPKPISVEVRERVVAAHREGLGTYEELAEIFSVGAASVNRWLRMARETGTLVPKLPPGRTPKLDETSRAILRELVETRPDATLAELGESLEQRLGVRLVPSAIFKVLAKMDISRKKRPSTLRNVSATTLRSCDGTSSDFANASGFVDACSSSTRAE
jgi:transposase